MSDWGTIEKLDSIHVVPLSEVGDALHICTLTCECRPTIQQPYLGETGAKYIAVHHDGH